MNTNTFTAIDFETINGNRGICQVGLVRVQDGEIIERYSTLCCPSFQEFNPFSMRVHGIAREDILGSRPFVEVWSEICAKIDGCSVVAHNAAFDLGALNNELLNCGLSEANPIGSFCTMQYFGSKAPLNELCEALNVPLSHHDAASDAEATARLYLLIHDNDHRIETLRSILAPSANKPRRSGFSLKGDVLRKDLENGDPSSRFFDKKVVITGFSSQDKIAIAQHLHALGADIDTAISSRTNIVCIGSAPGPSKMAKVEKLRSEGVGIEIIDNIFDVLGL